MLKICSIIINTNSKIDSHFARRSVTCMFLTFCFNTEKESKLLRKMLKYQNLEISLIKHEVVERVGRGRFCSLKVIKESTVVSTRTTHLYLLIAKHCTVLLLSQCSEWKNEKEIPRLEKVLNINFF